MRQRLWVSVLGQLKLRPRLLPLLLFLGFLAILGGRKLASEIVRMNYNATRDSLERCPMYHEFRSLDFLSPAVRPKLCANAEAYKQYPDGYPMCLLPNPFDDQLLKEVRPGSDVIDLVDVNNTKIRLFAYKGSDYVSNAIRRQGSWEPALVRWTLRFALRVPQATFLDIGSNIGVYSIQAAKLGLPVVALDANIRNLVRLRLSLNAASLNAALVWNFIAPDQKLKHLGFFAGCNVGAAGRDQADLTDTVPVMPLRSERLGSLISTRNLVMKMDIQGGEADFLRISGRLFTDFSVAAVQMEWSPDMIHGNDGSEMATFFTGKGFKAWQIPDFRQLDAEDSGSWEMMDIVWIHRDFQELR